MVCLLTWFASSICLVHGQGLDLLEAEEAAFRQAVESVAASVVQIETFGGLQRVGEELIAEGPTTGTIVAADGWIISSLFSFRQQPASILVTLPSGKRAAARIVARDYSREVALLKVDTPEALPVAPVAPRSEVQVGQWTVALGKTYDKQNVSQSVGIVSALGRAYNKAIQTDAKVSPINYGGPLVDIAGRIIGILSPISPGAFLEGDSSQLYDSGIGFAIPMADIVARLPSMQAGKDIHSGKLGVVTADQNELIGPVRISGTAPGSPAAKAHLKAGDVIVRAGEQPIALLADLKHALGPLDAGEQLTVVVERAGQELNFETTLAAEIPIYRRRFLGIRVNESELGLQLTAVESGTPAARAGLQAGQIITHCNDQPLTEKKDLLNFLAVAELDQPLTLRVLPQPPPRAAADNDQPAPPESSESQEVPVMAVTWPESLPQTLPPVSPSIEESMLTEVVDVVLGDFPNKAFAIIPPLSNTRPLGLLIVFPEPGELNREKTQAYWASFCRDYGWIVAVINSGNPRSWSREEIELAGRVLGRLDNNYSLDKSRTVIAGLGVGGRIALAATLSETQRVSATLTVGTELPRFRWPRSNAPMQSIDFLLVGPDKPLAAVAASLNEMGYVANAQAANHLDVSKWETLPTETIHRWLEGLGRL